VSEQLVKLYVRRTEAQRDVTSFPDWRDGSRCGVRFRYTSVLDRWYMWLIDLDGSTIAGPKKLVPGRDLLLGDKHDPRVPPGQLFVYSPDRLPPTAATVDVAAVLYYRRVESS
jgi:hypothetical protein